MPVKIIFYKEDDGSVPVIDWFDRVTQKARDKIRARIERLKALGHEIRRPEADYLAKGIYELRVSYRRIQYRILYFFHGRTAVVLSSGFTKKRVVPASEIKKAIERKRKFEKEPEKHTSGDPE